MHERNACSPRSYYCTDPSHLKRIRVALLDAHDSLSSQGKPTSIRDIMRAMPFIVNERLLFDVRRSLVEDGLLPPPLRSGRPIVDKTETKTVYLPNKQQLDAAKAEIIAENLFKYRDRPKKPDVRFFDHREASAWAVTRYKKAWKAIRKPAKKQLVRDGKKPPHFVYAASGLDRFA